MEALGGCTNLSFLGGWSCHKQILRNFALLERAFYSGLEARCAVVCWRRFVGFGFGPIQGTSRAFPDAVILKFKNSSQAFVRVRGTLPPPPPPFRIFKKQNGTPPELWKFISALKEGCK